MQYLECSRSRVCRVFLENWSKFPHYHAPGPVRTVSQRGCVGFLTFSCYHTLEEKRLVAILSKGLCSLQSYLYLLCYHNIMCVKKSSKRGKFWRSKFLFYLPQKAR